MLSSVFKLSTLNYQSQDKVAQYKANNKNNIYLKSKRIIWTKWTFQIYIDKWTVLILNRLKSMHWTMLTTIMMNLLLDIIKITHWFNQTSINQKVLSKIRSIHKVINIKSLHTKKVICKENFHKSKMFSLLLGRIWMRRLLFRIRPLRVRIDIYTIFDF